MFAFAAVREARAGLQVISNKISYQGLRRASSTDVYLFALDLDYRTYVTICHRNVQL
jgi:hypothetical protein